MIAPEHALLRIFLAAIFPFPPNLMYVIFNWHEPREPPDEGPFDRLSHLARFPSSSDSLNAHLDVLRVISVFESRLPS